MKQKRQARSVDAFSSYNWTPRTSYAILAKRRCPAELNDITLAKHERLERDLDFTKKTLDNIKTKTIQDIETQRKALRKTIHGKEAGIGVEKRETAVGRKTNSIFKLIQDENAKTFNEKRESKLHKGESSIYMLKDRFQKIREDIKDRLTDSSEHSLKTEKFKILLRRPSSADLLRNVKRLGALKGVRDVASPQSDSFVIRTSKSKRM